MTGEAGRQPPNSSDADGNDVCTPEVSTNWFTVLGSSKKSEGILGTLDT